MPASHGSTSIGILFALEIESRGLQGVLSHSRRVHTKEPRQLAWQIGNTRITAVTSGIGRANSARATRALADAGARTIINAGFAAALDGKACVGDVVVAARVLGPTPECQPIACDTTLNSTVPPSGSLGYSIWQSDIITCDELITAADRKRELFATTAAAALDMECYASAECCRQRGVPFLSIKAVSDTASEDLPTELVDLLSLTSTPGQALFVLRQPHIWRRLWRLRNHALKASENLGDALGTMLFRLSRG